MIGSICTTAIHVVVGSLKKRLTSITSIHNGSSTSHTHKDGEGKSLPYFIILKTNQMKDKGRIYFVKDIDKFDEWYDFVELDSQEKWKKEEVEYLDRGVYIRDDIYECMSEDEKENIYEFELTKNK
jgi:hypothetical protein